MKRTVALLCVTAMLLCCAACGKKPVDGGDKDRVTTTQDTAATGQNTTIGGNTPVQGTTGAEETPVQGTTTPDGAVQGTTSAPTTTVDGQVQGATLPPTTTTTTTAQIILNGEETFKETTVVDTAACRVTVLSIDAEAEMGYTLHVRFENLTKDKECMFSVDTAAINGLLTEPLFVTEVAAGEKEEDSIVFYDIAPEGVDIGEYTDIMLVFTVSDVNNWEAPPFVEKAAHIYPLGADKATVYRHTVGQGECLLVENEYITAIAVRSAEDTVWGGYYSDIYFWNKTGEALLFSIDEATVNTYGVEPYFATLIEPGYATFSHVEWLDDSPANSHIDQVEQLAFTLTVYRDMDWENMEEADWDDAILVNEEVRYAP